MVCRSSERIRCRVSSDPLPSKNTRQLEFEHVLVTFVDHHYAIPVLYVVRSEDYLSSPIAQSSGHRYALHRVWARKRGVHFFAARNQEDPTDGTSPACSREKCNAAMRQLGSHRVSFYARNEGAGAGHAQLRHVDPTDDLVVLGATLRSSAGCGEIDDWHLRRSTASAGRCGSHGEALRTEPRERGWLRTSDARSCEELTRVDPKYTRDALQSEQREVLSSALDALNVLRRDVERCGEPLLRHPLREPEARYSAGDP
jgi:hypothetical protein